MNSVSLEAGFALFVGFGALIMVVNIPMLSFIYCHPDLRKQKEVITIGFVCFADLIGDIAQRSKFAFLIEVEKRHHRLLISQTISPVEFTIEIDNLWMNTNCTQVIFPYFFIASYQLISVSTITITIDRVIAVTLPLKYRTFSWRYAYGLVGSAFALVALGFIVCVYFWFTLRTSTVSILCYTTTAYGPEIWNFMIYFRQLSTVASIIMYIPIAMRVAYLRRKSIAQKSVIRGANPYKRLVKTTVLIGITLLCEIIFVLIPDIFLNFNLFGLKKYELVWYLFVMSKGIINIFLYSFKQEDIKAALYSHLPARVKQRLTRLFTTRDNSSRGEPSTVACRTQQITTTTRG